MTFRFTKWPKNKTSQIFAINGKKNILCKQIIFYFRRKNVRFGKHEKPFFWVLNSKNLKMKYDFKLRNFSML